MSKKLKTLKSKAVSKAEYNSTNGWGFGGRAGTVYTFANGLQLFIGKFYYRHAPATESICLWDATGRGYSGSEQDFINEINNL